MDEYHQMVQSGILSPDERVELIEGQVIEMSPQLPPHATSVSCAAEYLRELLAGRAAIRAQLPVTLKPSSEPESEPEPDIALVQPPLRRYRDHHPDKSEIFLVIEIADTTLKGDRNIKAKMYARAYIADYWIVDIKERRLFVLRNPGQGIYQQEITLHDQETISPLAFPDASVSVVELLP